MHEKKVKAGWDALYKLFTHCDNQTHFNQLIDLMFTPEEHADLGMRVLIVKALLEGKESQRHISSTLNVSIAKITRGSNGLKRTSRQLRQYLQEQLDID